MKQLLFAGIFFTVTCALSWVLYFQYGNRPLGCSLDGSRIEPLYEVIIVDKDKSHRSFSCVVTARIWFSKNIEQISSILVTDESTGKKIKAEDAFYVVSEAVTTAYTGNKIHVFAQRSEATSHAKQFGGKLIGNPFQAREKEPILLVKHRHDLPSGPDFLFPSSQKPLSLIAKIPVITKQDYSYLPQESSPRLSGGYSSPLEKPPKTAI